MEEERKKWLFLEHPADVRIEVMGSDLSELFSNAAVALGELLSGYRGLTAAPNSAPDGRRVIIEADCVEDLVVDWLREILFLHESEGFLTGHVDIASISETRIEALLFAATPSQMNEQLGLDIKAVTYHDVSIQRRKDGLAVRLVFDV